MNTNRILEAKILTGEKSWKQFDEFVKNQEMGNLHQLSKWGEFQSKSPNRDKFWCVVVENQGEILLSALVVKQKLPWGKCWLYVPRGPVFKGDLAENNFELKKEELKVLVEKVGEIARAERAVFLRIDPGLEIFAKDSAKQPINVVAWAKLLQGFGFSKAHAHYQPENTLMVDLQGKEEEILAQMKPKGRYNIKLAEKKGVKIWQAGENKISLTEGVEEFYKILKETTSRDGFFGHKEKYYQNMMEILGSDLVKLYLAEFEGEIIAGTIITFFGDMAIYYFGASSNKHRNVMAPYLLQWEAMKEAKRRGIRWYDFLGVAPERAVASHPWAGVSEFKGKFGGVRVDYLPAQELVYDAPMFFLIKLKKWLNGLGKNRN